MHSQRLLDHFQNPRNAGEIEEPDVMVEVSNPICGDILRLSVDLDQGRIKRLRYKTRGCTAAIAVGSALTELLLGRSAEEAVALDREQVEQAVGGLANESKHAAVLALDAVKELLKKIKEPAPSRTSTADG